MYRICFAIDLFNGPRDREASHKVLNILLKALVDTDIEYLKDNPQTPSIYQSGVRYVEEQEGIEDWRDIPTCLRVKQGDCLPVDTLIMHEDGSFGEMRELVPGDFIYGDGDITRVTDIAFTGEKPLLAFVLQNGSTLRSSYEHRLFLQDGSEIRAEDVKVGQRLKCPTSLPTHGPWQFGGGLSDEDFAWLVGLYIADGWHEKSGSRFCISGDDVNPKRGKREQKDRVERIMLDLGISATRAKKYIAVHHRELTHVMARAGSHAPIKHIPNLRMTKSQVESMLLGLQADCSTANNAAGTLTHGTTSPVLALQLRVLYRMLGQSVHIRRWSAEEHRGLGTHPMYRVTVRRPLHDDMSENWKTRSLNDATSTKVLSIREEEPTECCDITTESGRFYLPETDVVVHNCEDLACWRVAELNVRQGIAAVPIFGFRTLSNGDVVYHIRVQYPNGQIEDPSRLLGMR